MAYVHIRIEDDFYKAIQSLLKEALNTDSSSFVRDIFRDTLLIYGDHDCKAKAFDKIGRKYEADAIPTLILYLANEWCRAQGIDRLNFDRASDNKISFRKNLDRAPDKKIEWPDFAQHLSARIIEKLLLYIAGPIGKDQALSRLEHLLDQEIKHPHLVKPK
jgi:hypothetical protein